MAHLVGETLSVALARTERPVELRDLAGLLIQASLQAMEIVAYVSRGYEVHGTKRRVRYVCPPTRKPVIHIDRRQFPLDTHYWDGRACLRYWADQVSPGMVTRAA